MANKHVAFVIKHAATLLNGKNFHGISSAIIVDFMNIIKHILSEL